MVFGEINSDVESHPGEAFLECRLEAIPAVLFISGRELANYHAFGSVNLPSMPAGDNATLLQGCFMDLIERTCFNLDLGQGGSGTGQECKKLC